MVGIKDIASMEKQSDSSSQQRTEFSQEADYYSFLLIVGRAEAQEAYRYVYNI